MVTGAGIGLGFAVLVSREWRFYSPELPARKGDTLVGRWTESSAHSRAQRRST